MKTRYGPSPWIHEFPASRRPAFPRFRQDDTADVVIIGGGLTGCAAAYVCAAAGFRTLLLERDRVGHGRSGHNLGLLTPEPGPDFRDIAAAHGLRAARRVFAAWRRGALDGAALLRRLKVRCGLEPGDLVASGGPEQEKRLQREYDARRGAGLTVGALKAKQLAAELRVERAVGLRIHGAFTLDPYRACVGLAVAARRRGALLFEQSAVRKVRFTRKYADVFVESHTIRTPHVVVTTGSATPEFGQLRRHFRGREMSAVMTEPVPRGIRRQLGDPATVVRDVRVTDRWVRWTGGDRLIVAGADRDESPVRARDALLLPQTGELMYELLTMYPAIFGLQPAYGWTVAYAETADRLMYIGAHRNYPHHVFALGGSGASVTGAFVAARILLRALQGEPDKADDVFGWHR